MRRMLTPIPDRLIIESTNGVTRYTRGANMLKAFWEDDFLCVEYIDGTTTVVEKHSKYRIIDIQELYYKQEGK